MTDAKALLCLAQAAGDLVARLSETPGGGSPGTPSNGGRAPSGGGRAPSDETYDMVLALERLARYLPATLDRIWAHLGGPDTLRRAGSRGGTTVHALADAQCSLDAAKAAAESLALALARAHTAALTLVEGR
ncbi:hypothetical protein GCM10018793_61610 [Streptomyces sulfonofaciens]|uniref:Uncharacterized protein n=1 Tax=Streptomyces sulfonofaciens TaxID=68272 RepID=A0A919GMC0_9ACTN|nr:hypothetical protein [Streptomyces sulfonofaciens]GHH87111.1 hypothetical protein GCM10018793_61610 [Streptomyces sulfonofaciens]